MSEKTFVKPTRAAGISPKPSRSRWMGLADVTGRGGGHLPFFSNTVEDLIEAEREGLMLSHRLPGSPFSYHSFQVLQNIIIMKQSLNSFKQHVGNF